MNNRGIASLIRRYQEGGEVEDPAYVAGVSREDRRMDPWLAQLLYGMPDASGTLQGGFLPGAFAAAESSFFDEEGKPIVVGEWIEDFTPDQLAAFDLTRRNVGIQQPFLEGANEAYASGIGSLDYGLDQQLLQGRRGMSTLKGAAGYEQAQRMLGLQDALGGIGEARGLASLPATGPKRSGVDWGKRLATFAAVVISKLRPPRWENLAGNKAPSGKLPAHSAI